MKNIDTTWLCPGCGEYVPSGILNITKHWDSCQKYKDHCAAEAALEEANLEWRIHNRWWLKTICWFKGHVWPELPVTSSGYRKKYCMRCGKMDYDLHVVGGQHIINEFEKLLKDACTNKKEDC